MRTTEAQPIGHVVNPYVVGGAVIGLKCKEGVVIGSDTLLSYGSLLKYPDVCRFQKIADNVLIAASGQYSDFQEVTRKLKDLSKQCDIYDDGVQYSAKDYANYLASICYEKRNKMNPYFNNIVISGIENNECILASVDMYGNYIKKDYVTTGFSKHFGLSLIANDWNPNCSMKEAKDIIRRCFEVIYMRDCHSIDQIQFGTITTEGAFIEQPEKIQSKWSFKEFKERKNEKLWQ